MRLRMYYPVLATAVLIVLLHLVLAQTETTYYMTQITMSAYYALVVIGLCLLMGYAGQASIGHAGFFAIGGYTAAVLTTYNLNPVKDTPLVARLQSLGLTMHWQDIYGADILSFTPWAAFGAALLLTGVIALVIGASVIQLKGHYLAMATLGFGLIVYRIALGTPVLGRADGVSNVPPFHLFSDLQVNGRAAFRVQNYYIAWVVVLAAMVLALNLVHSRVGRALRSIHENEEAAHSLGVNTYRYKLAVFLLSAIFAAIGGVLLTHYNGSIGPAEAHVIKSVRYVAIVAVGGMANLWGAMVMGIFLNFLSLRGVFGSFDETIFGGILILMMLFAPQGLLRVPRLRALTGLRARRKHA
ncbi:MAG: branched-chain amino acid ABC transporter permease [Planctomycetes bacterium]|nr:branched-chain amino acid ABC transporter permease [Planctomycetota bacterium]